MTIMMSGILKVKVGLIVIKGVCRLNPISTFTSIFMMRNIDFFLKWNYDHQQTVWYGAHHKLIPSVK